MAIIFDLDGTLIDSLPAIATSLNESLARSGLAPHSVTEVRSFIGNGSRELAKRALPKESSDNLVLTIERRFKAHYAKNWRGGTLPFPGIEALLASLGDRKLAVLSNKPHVFTCEIVSQLFPSIDFKTVRGQLRETPLKPFPDSALAVVRELGTTCENACFVGDSTVDRETALRAKIPFVAVSWGYDDVAHLGETVVESVEHLGRWLTQ